MAVVRAAIGPVPVRPGSSFARGPQDERNVGIAEPRRNAQAVTAYA
jgi:hypothetical protein